MSPSLQKFLNFIAWASALLLLGTLGLVMVGKIFLKEIVQEVSLEQPQTQKAEATLGQAAPYFELPDLQGATKKLSDLAGQPVVLTFWSTWNTLSADQIRVFDDYLAKNENALFQIVTINHQEDPSLVANFVIRGSYEVPVLLDRSGEVGERYMVRNLPTTYFLDQEGKIRDISVGTLDESMVVDKIEELLR